MIVRQNVMRPYLTILITAIIEIQLGLANSVCLTGAQLSGLHLQFWDSFNYPQNLEQVQAVNSTLFAASVSGRVDASTVFLGRGLNTEYIFGAFSSKVNPIVQGILGAPISYEVVKYIASCDTVLSSTVVIFNQSSLSPVTLIEIDTWIKFNLEGQIILYDATFRWLDWLLNDLVQSWESIGGVGQVVKTLAKGICDTERTYCTSSLQQYKDLDACLGFLLNGTRLGAAYEFGRNTLLCRNVHARLLQLDPALHCPHVGPDGGGMCTDKKSYLNTVQEPGFSFQ